MGLPAHQDIVLVDDSDVDSYFLKRWLGKSELSNPLRTFATGQSFLDHMSAVESSGGTMPALVLLDINMPELNGFQVLRALRKRSAFRQSPDVVLYTHSDDPQDKKRAQELGAGFVEKFSCRAEALDFLNSWGSQDA